MPQTTINLRRFGEYKNIFGWDKMRCLWQEYLLQSHQNWQDMATLDFADQRLLFHNWRSSSLVFGMDKYAACCQRIEDHILNCRFSGLSEQIAACSSLFQQSAAEVAAIFSSEDNHHES